MVECLKKIESVCDKYIHIILKKYVSVFFTPVFAILNYFQLAKPLKNLYPRFFIFFFLLSIVYTISTVFLAGLLAYDNYKKSQIVT